MKRHLLILPGDGIGPEIAAQAEKLLDAINQHCKLTLTWEHGLLGGAAIDATGVPLPDDTLAKAKNCDAILLGAVGGPKWDTIDRSIRPEKGLLKLRESLGLFGNLRPATLYPQLIGASSLKPEIVSGLDILIVRELIGDVYFGKPRGIRTLDNGEREGYNTYRYAEHEIQRIGKLAFEAAQQRNNRLCSVDKANVLETSVVWRETMNTLAKQYPDVELSHMYVDNAAMQLIRAPKQFDVIVTGNLFGDILSDAAAMLTGSIGMLPSASLNEHGMGMYEPCHGSAPDIAGQNCANPLAMLLSVAMMLRYSLHASSAAQAIEQAIAVVLEQGLRTMDIATKTEQTATTSQIGDAVVNVLGSC